jgi:hypothetical protein
VLLLRLTQNIKTLFKDRNSFKNSLTSDIQFYVCHICPKIRWQGDLDKGFPFIVLGIKKGKKEKRGRFVSTCKEIRTPYGYAVHFLPLSTPRHPSVRRHVLQGVHGSGHFNMSLFPGHIFFWQRRQERMFVRLRCSSADKLDQLWTLKQGPSEECGRGVHGERVSESRGLQGWEAYERHERCPFSMQCIHLHRRVETQQVVEEILARPAQIVL